VTSPAPSPERYRHTVIAHIMLDDASAAIEFYQRALSATELFRIAGPHGRILHAEISVGGAVVMVGDAEPPFTAPTASGSTTVGLHIYLDDVDTALARAEQAGATILQPAQDMFSGDRAGMLQDPFGHIWVLLTHQEDLEPTEITQRGEALLEA
jgi:PhnB protein